MGFFDFLFKKPITVKKASAVAQSNSGNRKSKQFEITNSFLNIDSIGFYGGGCRS